MFKGLAAAAVPEWCRTDLALGRPVDTGELLDLCDRLSDQVDELRGENKELADELRAAEKSRDRAEMALQKIAGGTKYDGFNHSNMWRRDLMRVASKALADTDKENDV